MLSHEIIRRIVFALNDFRLQKILCFFFLGSLTVELNPCPAFSFLANSAFIWTDIWTVLSYLKLFIFSSWYLISLWLLPYTYLRFLFDPLYEEIVTDTSDLMVYMVRHIFIELVLPLSIFVSVMLTLFVNWSWVPISSIERERGPSLEEVKKHLFD